MKRALKILLAVGCFIAGVQLSLHPDYLYGDSDNEWIYQLTAIFGCLLAMTAGLYAFLKLIRPAVCPETYANRNITVSK